MLFRPSAITDDRSALKVETARYEQVADTVRARGLEFVMLLVPAKSTIYEPWIADRAMQSQATGANLNRLEAEFRGKGIAVVNLVPVFQQEASKRLSQRRYLYHLDDTHWNADGVRLGAEQLDRAIRH
jgi:hypothetical protein